MKLNGAKSVYIAGKIGSAGIDAMRGVFDDAAARFRCAGLQVINPCDVKGGDTWQSCMIADLHCLLNCDAVFALSNWRSSLGATIEIQLALRLGKKVWFEVPGPLCMCGGLECGERAA